MGIRFQLAFCTLLALFFAPHARARLAPFAADPQALSLQTQAQAHPPAEKEQSLLEKTGEGRENEEAEVPAEEERHHSRDRSMVGGGVIIGGLATAIFAAVYCYIRVTRKRASTAPAPAPALVHPQPLPLPLPPK